MRTSRRAASVRCHAAATPVTLNGFVTSSTAASARSGSTSTQGAPVAALDEALTRNAAACSLTASTRSPQNEVAPVAERAKTLSDAWLKELEERAKQQWQQLVDGR